MISALFAVSLAMASYENQPRVPEDCEAMVYAYVDKRLPKNQFVTRMRINPTNPTGTLIDLEITKDQGQSNFCVAPGTATVRYLDYPGECEVIRFQVESDQFDCG